MTLRWVFKNGYTFDMECECITSNEKDSLNWYKQEWSIKGIKNNFPYLWDRDDLMIIHRVNEPQNEDQASVYDGNLVYTGPIPSDVYK
jgi:hypothetical protein